MRYCKCCLQPDTRPKIKFFEDGVCYACKYQEKIDREINWSGREQELKAIADWAKENSGNGFDCVIGVSGGKDSTYQAFYARDKLGLKPLLVNLAPDCITPWGQKNIENLIQHGFDTVIIRPNPQVWKKVIKYSFYRYGNPVKPTEYPLWASAYLMAINFKVPLILQGENAGLTLGIVDGYSEDGNAFNVNKLDTMNGGNANDWMMDGVLLKDIFFYQFPQITNSDIKAVWLNYFDKNWGYKYNTDFAVSKGLVGRPDHKPELTGRLSPYCSIDAESHQIVNQMIKYYKFGFGFVTDEVCYYIRSGDMTREEGIDLIKEYDGCCGAEYIQDFCNYLNIDLKEFWRVVDSYVNRSLFKKGDKDKRWLPVFNVGEY